MQWRVELKTKAAQAINKLDAQHRERIRAFLKAKATHAPTEKPCKDSLPVIGVTVSVITG